MEKQIFCSLDIESSDFDPANGEVLEIGMVFFQIEKSGIKILNEWQSTFKPSKPVSARILALTGITEEELEKSPLYREKFEEVQELVKDAVIVGHNINFDIRFLQAFGMKFSGLTIDTLDLAQIFLPTASSYNLESLMAFLKVSHKDAHRALADARATLVVLEKLLAHFASFPAKLQEDLRKLFAGKGKTAYKNVEPIMQLLETSFTAQAIQQHQVNVDLNYSDEITDALKTPQRIITFPLGFDYYSYIYRALSKGRDKKLLVVPDKKVLYNLWRKDVIAPYYEPEDLFDPEKFEKNLKKKNSYEKKIFLAKILVWQQTNWQSHALVDLNLSFFGNQYRHLICCDDGARQQDLSKEKNIACDYESFISQDLTKGNVARSLIILDINNFENALTFVTSKKASWNDFIYAVKQICDPEKAEEGDELKPAALAALSSIDLFFGMASMNIRKLNQNDQNILITDALAQSDQYAVMQKSFQGFMEKMAELNETLQSDRVDHYLKSIAQFFVRDPKVVQWVEISEGRLAFYTSPIDLADIAEEKIQPFKKTVFTASLGSEALIKYFASRLGISGFQIKAIGQQELRKKFEVIIMPQAQTEFSGSEKFLKFIKDLKAPAAVLLPSSMALKQVYENNFKSLGDDYKVFAQGYSGGTNKMLENFAHHQNGLFLGTDYFILKQFNRRLKVKELVLTRLPFERFDHPLFAAQAEKYSNKFVDFNIPRALYNFHSIIRFFYSEDLEKIYILDQKMSKEYGKYFIDYLKSLPFVDIKS